MNFEDIKDVKEIDYSGIDYGFFKEAVKQALSEKTQKEIDAEKKEYQARIQNTQEQIKALQDQLKVLQAKLGTAGKQQPDETGK